MFLTAQHVASSAGAEGINAFVYHHGPYVWHGLPPAGIPDTNTGMLVAQTIEQPPPGNRLRSYLDVVAPDETPSAEIQAAFVAFVTAAQGAPLPWHGVIGRVSFRMDMDAGCAATWQQELAVLYRAVQAVRIGG